MELQGCPLADRINKIAGKEMGSERTGPEVAARRAAPIIVG